MSVMPRSSARGTFGPDDQQPERRPGGLHGVPHLERALGAEREDLVAGPAAPAGARDDAGHARDLGVREPVVAEALEGLADERLEHRPRERPLQLHRRDVGLAHGHVEAGAERDALRPQQQVDVAVRQPDAAVLHVQHDGSQMTMPFSSAIRVYRHAPGPSCDRSRVASRSAKRQRVGTGEARPAAPPPRPTASRPRSARGTRRPAARP